MILLIIFAETLILKSRPDRDRLQMQQPPQYSLSFAPVYWFMGSYFIYCHRFYSADLIIWISPRIFTSSLITTPPASSGAL